MIKALALKKIHVQHEGKALNVAEYYGFEPIRAPESIYGDSLVLKFIQEMIPRDALGDDTLLTTGLAEKVAVLRTYLTGEYHTLPQPALLCYDKPLEKSYKKKHPKERRFGLEIIGTTKSIAEAILIKTSLAILEEEGYDDLVVEVNSLGDKESSLRYVREVTLFFKKHIHMMKPSQREMMKENPVNLMVCHDETIVELCQSAPKPMNFLSEESRRHFKEVLEYLEHLQIPYEINNKLVCRHSPSGTVFEIKERESGRVLAAGLRYDGITKRLGFRKEIGATGVNLSYMDSGKKSPRGTIGKKPKFFFAQLGFDAKLRSLEVVEILRKARVPMIQALARDKMGGQITNAESMHIPYAIIMGQKEALDGTVIVRHMETRKQETVPIKSLGEYVKTLK